MNVQRNTTVTHKPITITLETYEEAAALMALCGEVAQCSNVYRTATDSLYDNLLNLGIRPAEVVSSITGVEFK